MRHGVACRLTFRLVIETILGRRSIRDGFEPRAVPDELVDTIVRCGLVAPSSKNAQPWRIHRVADRGVLCELGHAVQGAKDADRYVPIDPATGQPRPDWPSTVAESAAILRQVSLGLFIENQSPFSGGRGTMQMVAEADRAEALVGYTFEVLGLGAAMHAMWLAAAELGLAGVFMGDVLIAEQAIRARLGMTGDLVGVLALGYSSEVPTPKHLAPAREVVHPSCPS